jgi:hypothetical protein
MGKKDNWAPVMPHACKQLFILRGIKFTSETTCMNKHSCHCINPYSSQPLHYRHQPEQRKRYTIAHAKQAKTPTPVAEQTQRHKADVK